MRVRVGTFFIPGLPSWAVCFFFFFFFFFFFVFCFCKVFWVSFTIPPTPSHNTPTQDSFFLSYVLSFGEFTVFF